MTGTLPLWIAAGLYVWQAWNYVQVGQPGMAVAFIGYAAANLGFVWHYLTIVR